MCFFTDGEREGGLGQSTGSPRRRHATTPATSHVAAATLPPAATAHRATPRPRVARGHLDAVFDFTHRRPLQVGITGGLPGGG